MSGGVPFAYGFEGVAGLLDDLAVDHLELGRVDDGGISDRDDLPVNHLGYGVGEAVAACASCCVHRLTGAGCEPDAVWIQCEPIAGDGVGKDDVLACTGRLHRRGVVHPVVLYICFRLLGRCDTVGVVDFDFLLDFIRELDHRLFTGEHSPEIEREADVGGSGHTGIIGISFIPGKRNDTIPDLEVVVFDGIRLSAHLDRDIDITLMADRIKAIRNGVRHRSVIELQPFGILPEKKLDEIFGPAFYDVRSILPCLRMDNHIVDEVFKICIIIRIRRTQQGDRSLHRNTIRRAQQWGETLVGPAAAHGCFGFLRFGRQCGETVHAAK